MKRCAASVRSRSRPVMMTRIPARARPSAVWRPIPAVAPVTRATFPEANLFGRQLVVSWLGCRHDLAADRGALHQPLVAERVMGGGAVQHYSVVPDHQIAFTPGVAVAELRLGAEVVEPRNKLAAFVARPTDHVRAVRADVDRLAVIDRVLAHHDLPRAGQLSLHLGGQRRGRHSLTREDQAVLGDES